MYFVYILKSVTKNRYYIGQTQNLSERLKLHNSGLVKSTKYGIPWELLFCEKYAVRAEACRREKQIKSYKGGEAFKKLIRRGVA